MRWSAAPAAWSRFPSKVVCSFFTIGPIKAMQNSDQYSCLGEHHYLTVRNRNWKTHIIPVRQPVHANHTYMQRSPPPISIELRSMEVYLSHRNMKKRTMRHTLCSEIYRGMRVLQPVDKLIAWHRQQWTVRGKVVFKSNTCSNKKSNVILNTQTDIIVSWCRTLKREIEIQFTYKWIKKINTHTSSYCNCHWHLTRRHISS